VLEWYERKEKRVNKRTKRYTQEHDLWSKEKENSEPDKRKENLKAEKRAQQTYKRHKK
jgi:hypothetical protein